MNTKFFNLSSRDPEADQPGIPAKIVQTTFKIRDTIKPLIKNPRAKKACVTLVKGIINATEIPMMFTPRAEDYVIAPYRKTSPSENGYIGYFGLHDSSHVRLTQQYYYTIEDMLYELNNSMTELWCIGFNENKELTITLADEVAYPGENPVFPKDTTIAVSTELKKLLECFPGMFRQQPSSSDILVLPGAGNIASKMWILDLAAFRRRSAQGERGAQITPEALTSAAWVPTPVPQEPVPDIPWDENHPLWDPELDGPPQTGGGLEVPEENPVPDDWEPPHGAGLVFLPPNPNVLPGETPKAPVPKLPASGGLQAPGWSPPFLTSGRTPWVTYSLPSPQVNPNMNGGGGSQAPPQTCGNLTVVAPEVNLGGSLGFTGVNDQPDGSVSKGPMKYLSSGYAYKYWTVTSHFPNFNRFFTIRTVEFHATGLGQQPMESSNARSTFPLRTEVINSVNIDSGFNNSLIYYHPYTDMQKYYLTRQDDIYEFEIKCFVTYANGSRIPLTQLTTDESQIVLRVEYEDGTADY